MFKDFKKGELVRLITPAAPSIGTRTIWYPKGIGGYRMAVLIDRFVHQKHWCMVLKRLEKKESNVIIPNADKCFLVRYFSKTDKMSIVVHSDNMEKIDG